MKYYEELINRICMVLEERLYVDVEYTESVEGYELILSSQHDEGLRKNYKVHYRDLERNEPVLNVTQNIVSSFTADYRDSIYRPN